MSSSGSFGHKNSLCGGDGELLLSGAVVSSSSVDGNGRDDRALDFLASCLGVAFFGNLSLSSAW